MLIMRQGSCNVMVTPKFEVRGPGGAAKFRNPRSSFRTPQDGNGRIAINIGLTIRCDGLVSDQIAQKDLHPCRQSGQSIA